MLSRHFYTILFFICSTFATHASFQDSTVTKYCVNQGDVDYEYTETKYCYNTFGNLKSVRSYYIENNVHYPVNTSDYTYDALQNLIAHIDSSWNYSSIPNVAQYYYSYDASNLLDTFVTFTYSNGGLSTQAREDYAYDANDNLISTTYYSGIPLTVNKKIEKQYDASGFVSSIKNSTGSPLVYSVRTDYQNNSAGKDTLRISYSWQNNLWIIASRTVTIFQSNDTAIMASYVQLPDTVIGWTTSRFDTLFYHANGHLLMSMSFVINNLIIDTTERIVYTYSSFAPLVYHVSREDYYLGAWDPYSWQDYSFDSVGNAIYSYSSCLGCGYGEGTNNYNYNYNPNGLLDSSHSYYETHGGDYSSSDCKLYYYDIHGAFTICQTDTLTLSADSGFVSYLWSTGATTRSIRVWQDGLYSLQLTDTNGLLWEAAPHAVAMKAPPVASYATDSTLYVCRNGNNILLKEIDLPSYSYIWLVNGLPQNNYSSRQNEFWVNPYNSNSGIYRVRVSNECGFDTSSATIIIFSPDSMATISPLGSQSICYGDSITLTASMGTHYLWTPTLDTTQSVIIWQSGNYTVQIYDTLGCYSYATMNLLVTNNSHLYIYSVADSILHFQLPTSPYQSYVSWLFNGDSIPGEHGYTLVMHAPGDYRVILTSSYGCVDTVGPYIPNIKFNLGPDLDICSGVNSYSQNTNIYNGKPPYNYTWTKDGIPFASSTTSSNYLSGIAITSVTSVIDTIMYVAIITDSLGFTATDTQLVIVHPPPSIIPVITGNTDTICSGTTVTLTAYPPGNYKWYHGGIPYSSVYSNTWNASLPTFYSAAIMDVYGCISAQSNSISIFNYPGLATPAISINGSSPSCLGDTIQLVATLSPGLTYLWQSNDPMLNFISTTNVFSATSTNYYYVRTIDVNGCRSSSSVNTFVEFDTLFTFPITVYLPTVLCTGDSVRMESQSFPGYSYQWMRDNNEIAGANDTVYYATETGVHYLKITDTLSGCCAVSSEWLVQVRPVNNINVIQADSVLTATALIASTYQWYNNSLLLAGEDSNVFIGHQSGKYYVETVDYHGCKNISDTFDLDCSITLDVENVRCFNECNGSIKAITNGVSPLIYEWSTNDTINRIDTLCPGLYWIKVSDGWGCSDSAGVALSQPALMTVTLPDTFAIDCSGMCDTISVLSTGGNGGNIYQWSDALTGLFAQHCDTFPLLLLVTDSLGCQATDSTIGRYTSIVQFTYSVIHPSCSGCTDGQITIYPQSGNAPFNFTLNSNSYVINSVSDTLIIGTLSEGLYYMEFEAANSCQRTDSVLLSYSLGTVSYFEKSGIKIVPNPATGLCQIMTENNCPKKELTITDTDGRLILYDVYSEPAITLDVNFWNKGIYFVRVYCGQSVHFGKIIVQ